MATTERLTLRLEGHCAGFPDLTLVASGTQLKKRPSHIRNGFLRRFSICLATKFSHSAGRRKWQQNRTQLKRALTVGWRSGKPFLRAKMPVECVSFVPFALYPPMFDYPKTISPY